MITTEGGAMSDNRDLIGRVATTREQHQLHHRNMHRAEVRAAAELQFRARVNVASSVGRDWPFVRHHLIIAAVHDLYETLLITEGTNQ